MKWRKVKIFKMITIILAITVFDICQAYAEWQNSSVGTINYVRAYAVAETGLRLQVGVTGAEHTCGTGPTTYYFDSPMLTADVVKAITSLATSAMVAGKPVIVSYDCSIGHSGYGWGIALQVNK